LENKNKKFEKAADHYHTFPFCKKANDFLYDTESTSSGLEMLIREGKERRKGKEEN